MSALYCDHGRIAGGCETCALVTALERGYSPPDHPRAPAVERVAVEVDTLIERTDLGDGYTTLVVAGDNVPLGLEHLPRRSASEPTPATRAKAKGKGKAK